MYNFNGTLMIANDGNHLTQKYDHLIQPRTCQLVNVFCESDLLPIVDRFFL